MWIHEYFQRRQGALEKERTDRLALESQLKERLRDLRDLSSKHEAHVTELNRKCVCYSHCILYEYKFILYRQQSTQFWANFLYANILDA